MEFRLEKLPYGKDALEPYIGARTVEVHYEKHHRGYLEKLRQGIEGGPEERKSLVELIRTSSGGRFNLAAQIWNHTFYWKSLRPGGGGTPPTELLERIERSFGSVADFRQEFATVANGQFGSGWAWLVAQGESLKILSTSDAENPLQKDLAPLLTVDVWEHAYYLDYMNDRPAYTKACVDHLLNWDFAAENLQRATTIGSTSAGKS